MDKKDMSVVPKTQQAPLKNESEKPNSENTEVKIPVKFNKQEKLLTLDEAVVLAQKGMKYEIICDDYDALKQLATQRGLTVPQFIEALKNEERSKKVADIAKKHEINDELAMHIFELEGGKKGDVLLFDEVKKFFPQFKSEDDLPLEVIEEAKLKARPLLDQYLRYRMEKEQLAKKLSKYQGEAEKLSLGSQINRAGQMGNEAAEFLKGLWK